MSHASEPPLPAASASAAAAAYLFPPHLSVSEYFCLDSFDRYTKLGIIGTGAYGTVIKSSVRPSASHLHSRDRFVALKQLNSAREGFGIPQDAYRELKILREVRHENLVALQNILLKPVERELTLVYEFADLDLNDLIRYHRAKEFSIDIRIIKSIAHQLLAGLNHLHANWILHRDLKPQNILIEFGTIKIADFGLARIFRDPLVALRNHWTPEVVTLWYRSPELLLGAKHYGAPIDNWAIGCILFELLTTTPLFPGEEAKNKFEESQLRKIFHLLGKPTVADWPELCACPNWSKIADWPAEDFKYSLHEKLPANIDRDSQLFDLLKQLLRFDPNKRISAEAALQHPFFKESPLPNSNCLMKSNNSALQLPQRAMKPMNQTNTTTNPNNSTASSSSSLKRPRPAESEQIELRNNPIASNAGNRNNNNTGSHYEQRKSNKM